ncbi:hypothetical protein GCM10010112_82610 [Actinoplanes lobatus]|uniref:Uncharacterized protein n=1 Tax=Actinoplanes lobatus TaxID=113568 RepID=A0A7W7MJE1_9ACTN|nr:hypothetical protein [Actinoplanes lobatus]MBB4752552.1 hypothetical protein [Actinoplanes lobatus]GGN93866.1 hypothetical protein GCM10010112_82610 [Actinoplanes lobatus]GIE44850.1 hypothetical protein Alo02nite_77480 [Actinoplanes lobatus]
MNKKLAAALATTAAAASMALTTASPSAAAGAADTNPNLVQGGDFEWDGPLPEGTSTELRYVSDDVQGGWGRDSINDDTMYGEGRYTLGMNPKQTHELWADINFDSRKMIVNGFSTEDKKGALVWGQTVTLTKPVETYKLIAGQNTQVGTIEVSPSSATQIKVTYRLSSEAIAQGYTLTQIHLDTANAVADIPQSTGGPTPGRFEVNKAFTPGTTAAQEYIVDAGSVIAAHAVVTKTNPDTQVVTTDTAWAGANKFSGKNWALYATYAFEVPTYEFSMNAMNVYDQTGVGGDLTVVINGKPVATQVKLDGNAGEVVEVKDIVEYAPTVKIEIRNGSTLHTGNDFAIDDITLRMLGA